MQDYRVELDSYSGPLDLLLYLVRRHEIDLHNIPIAKLTEQYIEYLQLIQRIDVDLAGEFLVMAATLLEIKSALLLPRPTEDASGTEPQADPLDPRHELVQQLLAYKRFKDAAAELTDRRHEWAGRYACHPVKPPRTNGSQATDDDGDPNDAQTIEIDLEDANVLDLCQAFVRVIESVGQTPALHEVIYDDTPVALHAEDILDRLGRDGPMSLQEIFTGRESRSEKIGLLLAMLEMVRQSKITFNQDDEEGRIRLQLRPTDQHRQLTDDSRESTAASKAQSQQDPYEWPSEEARLAAQRRAQRHAQHLAKQSESKPPGPEEPSTGQIVTRVDNQNATPPTAGANQTARDIAQDSSHDG